MREHLYRGQRLDTREWVEGDLIRYLEPDRNYGIWTESDGIEIVTHESIGEFTSELDVTERRIFEDDVCIDALGDKWVIIFKKAAFMARGLESGVYWRNLDGSKLTVVGNIHDDKKGWL